MTIAADRISDTEIKIDNTIHTFDAKASADAFQQCLANDSARNMREESRTGIDTGRH